MKGHIQLARLRIIRPEFRAIVGLRQPGIVSRVNYSKSVRRMNGQSKKCTNRANYEGDGIFYNFHTRFLLRQSSINFRVCQLHSTDAILFRCDIFKYGVASGGVRSSSSVSTRYGVVTPFHFRQQTVFSLPCLDKATGCVRIPLLRLQSFARSHSEDSAPPPFATTIFF